MCTFVNFNLHVFCLSKLSGCEFFYRYSSLHDKNHTIEFILLNESATTFNFFDDSLYQKHNSLKFLFISN